MATHGMIDLETLNTTPDATILTVGGVKFNPYNTQTPHTDLYLKVDVDEQTKLGRTVNDQTLDVKTNNSDSENSIIDIPTEDVYDYYEDYYEAAYDNDQEVKSNIRKRSSSSGLANAAIIAAASAHT